MTLIDDARLIADGAAFRDEDAVAVAKAYVQAIDLIVDATDAPAVLDVTGPLASAAILMRATAPTASG